jgi:hypothetical protein
MMARGSDQKRLPLSRGGRAAGLVSLSIDKVASGVEVVVKEGVSRDELLQRLHLSEM